jgi:hypothetical protein
VLLEAVDDALFKLELFGLLLAQALAGQSAMKVFHSIYGQGGESRQGRLPGEGLSEKQAEQLENRDGALRRAKCTLDADRPSPVESAVLLEAVDDALFTVPIHIMSEPEQKGIEGAPFCK